MNAVNYSDVPGWIRRLPIIDGLWKSRQAVKAMDGEAALSVLNKAVIIGGAVSSAPADQTSGMCLGTAGGHG